MEIKTFFDVELGFVEVVVPTVDEAVIVVQVVTLLDQLFAWSLKFFESKSLFFLLL